MNPISHAVITDKRKRESAALGSLLDFDVPLYAAPSLSVDPLVTRIGNRAVVEYNARASVEHYRQLAELYKAELDTLRAAADSDEGAKCKTCNGIGVIYPFAPEHYNQAPCPDCSTPDPLRAECLAVAAELRRLSTRWGAEQDDCSELADRLDAAAGGAK
jgi:hypothetical protein